MRRALRAVVPYRIRFTALLRIGQALRRFLPGDLRARIPERRPAGAWPSRKHARSMLVWQGCVQPALAPDINAAAARALDRFGIRLIAAKDGCCGALSHHMAATDEARVFMRKNIDALWPHIEAGAEAIVLTASACGMHFREYGQLLHDDPQYRDKAKRISDMTRDIAEVVAEEWKEDPLQDLPAPQPARRIAFQSSCSLQHGEKLNGGGRETAEARRIQTGARCLFLHVLRFGRQLFDPATDTLGIAACAQAGNPAGNPSDGHCDGQYRLPDAPSGRLPGAGQPLDRIARRSACNRRYALI